MLRSALAPFLILATVVSAVASEKEDKAPPLLMLTAKDHTKTIDVQPGQKIEIQLSNAKPGAGWEPGGTEIRGASLALANPKRKGNCDEFRPEDPTEPKTTVGVYVFRYVAKETGGSKLRLTHLYPSGPEPQRRGATQLIAEFVITVNVLEK